MENTENPIETPNANEQNNSAQQNNSLADIFGNGPEAQQGQEFTEEEQNALGQLLGKVSKGKVTNRQQIEELLQVKDNYAATRAELEKLAKSQQAFANPIVAKINELYKMGGTPSDVKLFLDAQALDVDNLSNMELVREQYRRKYPTLHPEDIDNAIQEKYGNTVEAELSGAKKITLLQEANEAKEYLKQQKVQAEQPDHLKQKQEQQAQQEQMQQFIATQSQKISETVKSQEKYFFPMGGLGDYELPIKGNNDPELKKAIDTAANHAVQNVMHAGIDPNSTEGKKVIKDSFERALFYNYGREMLKDAIASMTNSVKKELKLKGHNIQPVKTPQQTPVTNVVLSDEEQIKKAAFKRGFR